MKPVTKVILGLLLFVTIFAQGGQKIKDDPQLALLEVKKETLTNEDFSNMLMKDLTNVSKFDSIIELKLSAILKNANNDENALGFIFAQALDGNLLSMLDDNQTDIDKKIKTYKEEEVFSPVANVPKVANVSDVANVPKTDNKTVNTSNAAGAVDPQKVAQQKAIQEQQMKEARAAIDSLFAQVDTKLNMRSAMPSINFNAPNASNRPNLPNPASGNDLPRVANKISVGNAK